MTRKPRFWIYGWISTIVGLGVIGWVRGGWPWVTTQNPQGQDSQPLTPPFHDRQSLDPTSPIPPALPLPPLPLVEESTALAQDPGRALTQDLLQDLNTCITQALVNSGSPSTTPGTTPPWEQMTQLSTACFFQVVMISPEGKVYSNVEERLEALVGLSGVPLPQASHRGTALVGLQPLGEALYGVSVTLGNQPQLFLLDTGASSSLVELPLAEGLGVAGIPIQADLLSYFVVGEDCTGVEARLQPIPELEVDQAEAIGLMGLALSAEAIPTQAVGVLGLDFLSGFTLEIDPRSSQMRLLEPSALDPQGLPLVGRLGIMATAVQANHQGPFLFALDTGAEQTVIREDVATQLGYALAPSQTTEVQGFCGSEQAYRITLDQVQAGAHQQRGVETIVLTGQLLDILGVDGILGQNFLRHYQQDWRFGTRNSLGYPQEGSLTLTAIP